MQVFVGVGVRFASLEREGTGGVQVATEWAGVYRASRRGRKRDGGRP